MEIWAVTYFGGILIGMAIGYHFGCQTELVVTYPDATYSFEDVAKALKLACQKIYQNRGLEATEDQLADKVRMLLREAKKCDS